MKYISTIFKSIFLVSFVTNIYASSSSSNQYYDKYYKFQNDIFFSASMSAGVLNSSAKEYVYKYYYFKQEGKESIRIPTPYVVSELDWKTKIIPIVNFNLILEKPSLGEINLRGFTSLLSSAGYMDDYDWLIDGQNEPSRHSWHPNTKTISVNEFDLNMKLWLSNEKYYKAGPIIGYQINNFKWKAIGGAYDYENRSGVFPEDPIISYEQRFAMAYIGLGTQLQFDRFELNAQFKYGPYVSFYGYDKHYLTSTDTYDTGSTKYYGVLIDTGFYITPTLKLFLEWIYNDYQNELYNTKIVEPNKTTYSYDGAGGSNRSNALSVGLKYTFKSIRF